MIKQYTAYTSEQYNELYANTLLYLLQGEKKFLFLLQETKSVPDKKEAVFYLNIIKKFKENLQIAHIGALKKYGYFNKK